MNADNKYKAHLARQARTGREYIVYSLEIVEDRPAAIVTLSGQVLPKDKIHVSSDPPKDGLTRVAVLRSLAVEVYGDTAGRVVVIV
jgi:hypothetical protein